MLHVTRVKHSNKYVNYIIVLEVFYGTSLTGYTYHAGPNEYFESYKGTHNENKASFVTTLGIGDISLLHEWHIKRIAQITKPECLETIITVN